MSQKANQFTMEDKIERTQNISRVSDESLYVKLEELKSEIFSMLIEKIDRSDLQAQVQGYDDRFTRIEKRVQNVENELNEGDEDNSQDDEQSQDNSLEIEKVSEEPVQNDVSFNRTKTEVVNHTQKINEQNDNSKEVKISIENQTTGLQNFHNENLKKHVRDKTPPVSKPNSKSSFRKVSQKNVNDQKPFNSPEVAIKSVVINVAERKTSNKIITSELDLPDPKIGSLERIEDQESISKLLKLKSIQKGSNPPEEDAPKGELKFQIPEKETEIVDNSNINDGKSVASPSETSVYSKSLRSVKAKRFGKAQADKLMSMVTEALAKTDQNKSKIEEVAARIDGEVVKEMHEFKVGMAEDLIALEAKINQNWDYYKKDSSKLKEKLTLRFKDFKRKIDDNHDLVLKRFAKERYQKARISPRPQRVIDEEAVKGPTLKQDLSKERLDGNIASLSDQ